MVFRRRMGLGVQAVTFALKVVVGQGVVVVVVVHLKEMDPRVADRTVFAISRETQVTRFEIEVPCNIAIVTVQ